MERIYSTSQFSWGHDITEGRRVSPPTEEDLVDGMLPPNWQPTVEDVKLDTVIIADGDMSDSTVFKIAMDKETLANFLVFYVQFLDTDGRNALREELAKTSDIVIPPKPTLTRVK